MPVFWVLMAAISVSCIGMIPHYVLYAKKKDLSILYVNLICFCLFLVCSFFVVKSYEVIGMAYLILFVFVSMLIMKILAITI
jgi:O-antigen/teichoic acid export membrane protein